MLPIPRHNRVSAAHDFADFTDGRHVAIGAQHRNLHSRPGIADRTQNRVVVGFVVDAAQSGDGHRRLALAIDLGEDRPECRDRLAQALDVHRAAAVDDRPEIGGAAPARGHQPLHHRRG